MAGFPGRDYSNLLGSFTAERVMVAAEPQLPCLTLLTLPTCGGLKSRI